MLCPLGEALVAGGLPLAEITFRTEAAEAAIKTLSQKMPDMLVGAGTVLKVDQVKRAVDGRSQVHGLAGFQSQGGGLLAWKTASP